MTVTNGYTTAELVSARASADGTALGVQFGTFVDDAVTAASRVIDAYCGRFFYSAGSSEKKVLGSFARYEPNRCCYVLDIPDASTVTQVQLDLGDNGTATTVNGSTYFTEPLNGEVEGLTGWPVTRLVFPDTALRTYGRYPLAEVTATWGWSAVPQQVEEACQILAVDMLHARDLAFGIIASEGGMMRLRENPRALSLLAPFRRAGLGLPAIA